MIYRGAIADESSFYYGRSIEVGSYVSSSIQALISIEALPHKSYGRVIKVLLFIEVLYKSFYRNATVAADKRAS